MLSQKIKTKTDKFFIFKKFLFTPFFNVFLNYLDIYNLPFAKKIKFYIYKIKNYFILTTVQQQNYLEI